jgi:secreted PhoX family phosphatase
MSACILMGTAADAQTCKTPQRHISNFTSVLPTAQPDSLRIPSTHTFQMIVQKGQPYTDTSKGTVRDLFDFTGYVPFSAGNSRKGYIDLNHEGGNTATGGVSVIDVQFDSTKKLWNVTNKALVDFAVAGGTGRNCSGGITPWGTSVTSEETLPTGDANGDGYQDIGWQVEVNPATRAIVDYNGNGTPDKIFRMGRMSHENFVINDAGTIAYETNDENPGYVFKYVLDTPGKLANGKLYVLKLDGALNQSDIGSWIQIPNNTPTECNNVRAAATSAGATNFNSLEDIEIAPHDGMIYFTSKSSSRVYRFRDMGATVSQVEVFAGDISRQYLINYDHNGTKGSAYEQWRDGVDNLAFDDLGNLYVIQDGGRNHIWMVTPCHTQAKPDVKLFAVIPDGAEPTGMTFTPDYRYMFVSIQHPDATNKTAMKDAADSSVIFNRESAIVIARRGYLGKDILADTIVTVGVPQTGTGSNALAITKLYPNPATSDVTVTVSSAATGAGQIKIYSMTGALVATEQISLTAGSSTHRLQTASLTPGTYNLILTSNEGTRSTRFVKQ